MHKLSDYDFMLPEKLIAQKAAFPADSAKLLLVNIDKDRQKREDKTFLELPELLGKESVIFFNNSKVIKARIPLKNCKVTREYLSSNHKYKNLTLPNGEIFIYEIISFEEGVFEALVSDDKHFKPGSIITYNENITFQCMKYSKDGITIKMKGYPLKNFLDLHAEMPLPPYISYNKKKETDYQNVFAKEEGSVAAPTAGLHFTSRLLDKLQKKGLSIEFLTLHVSLGTFKPIYTENIMEHDIHEEKMFLDKSIFTKIAHFKKNQKEIIAIGTTSTRVLESLPYLRKSLNISVSEEYTEETKEYWNKVSIDITANNKIIHELRIKNNNIECKTKLYITPGFHIKIIDKLITNFHLPKSSLLILVATILGYQNWKDTYEYAIKQGYMFYSFGDGMMINVKKTGVK